VTDVCAYNQWQSRRDEDVSAVTDLMLSMRLVETRGQGLLVVRATDGRDEFDVRLDPVRGRYEILQNGRPVPAAIGRIPPWDGELWVEFSLFDQQLLLAFNGETRVQWPYDPAPTPPKTTAQPLAIGAQGLGVLIRELRVYRDVYYTHPPFVGSRAGLDQPLVLGEDEYCMLGDNSPISEDSRTWPEGSAVPGCLLVGKPLFVHFPAKRVQIGGWVFQVPDPARIRYIR
jgi:signal peptidase I